MFMPIKYTCTNIHSEFRNTLFLGSVTDFFKDFSLYTFKNKIGIQTFTTVIFDENVLCFVFR